MPASEISECQWGILWCLTTLLARFILQETTSDTMQMKFVHFKTVMGMITWLFCVYVLRDIQDRVIKYDEKTVNQQQSQIRYLLLQWIYLIIFIYTHRLFLGKTVLVCDVDPATMLCWLQDRQSPSVWTGLVQLLKNSGVHLCPSNGIREPPTTDSTQSA